MMAMAMMDRGMSQTQWMTVRYIEYANNAGGKTSKGMDFVEDFFLQFVNFFPTYLVSFQASNDKRTSVEGLVTV